MAFLVLIPILILALVAGGAIGIRRNAIDATGVVDVAVGDQQRHRCEIEFGKQVSDPGRIRRCIDDHRRPTAVGGDHVRIRAEVPEGARFDQHGSSHPGSEHKAVGVVYGFYLLEASEDKLQSFAV